jgi:hypothetical protein
MTFILTQALSELGAGQPPAADSAQRRPLAILYLGAGAGGPLVEACLASPAGRLVLVEPQADLAQSLLQSLDEAAAARVRVETAALAPQTGPVELRLFNQADLSALRDAADLRLLYPGLQERGRKRVPGLALADLLTRMPSRTADSPAGSDLLVADLNGEEGTLAAALAAAPDRARFGGVVVRAGLSALYAGSPDVPTLTAALTAAGLSLAGRDDTDPDRPWLWFRRNKPDRTVPATPPRPARTAEDSPPPAAPPVEAASAPAAASAVTAAETQALRLQMAVAAERLDQALAALALAQAETAGQKDLLDALRHEMMLWKTRSEAAEARLAGLLAAQKELYRSRDALWQERNAARAERDAARAERDAARAEIAASAAQISGPDPDSLARIAALEADLAEIRGARDALWQERNMARTERDAARAEIAASAAQISGPDPDSLARIAALEAELAEIRGARDALWQERNMARAERDAARAERDNLLESNSNTGDLLRDLAEAQARISLLTTQIRAQQDLLEGVAPSSAAVAVGVAEPAPAAVKVQPARRRPRPRSG